MKIELKAVQKKYGSETVLSVKGLVFNPGEKVGVFGDNGAGKSTLFRLIAALSEPDAGEILYDGLPNSRAAQWYGRCGIYLDAGFLIDFYTVDEYLSLVGSLHRMSPAQMEKRKRELMGFFGDEMRAGKKLIRELSTGNKKKVGIAGALFHKPEVLLLDEPFADLDTRGKEWLIHALAEYGTRDRLMVISSHDVTLVRNLIDRIVFIDDGGVAMDGDRSLWPDIKALFG